MAFSKFALVAATALVSSLLTAPIVRADELGDVRETQKRILDRLDAQDKVLQEILKKVQALPAARPAVDPNKVYELPVAESPVRGPKKAAMTLIEFSDFQCPFCARSAAFAKEIGDAFPKDLKFVYKHLPLTQIHPNAMPAAKAAVAAQKQDKFWEMHDELFLISKDLSADNIRKAAEKVGLDMKDFEKDWAAPETEKLVQEDMKLAQTASVTGTPTFFLNGKRLTSRDVAVVKSMIEDELKKAKK